MSANLSLTAGAAHARVLLEEFVGTIEASGGVAREGVIHVPLADREWVDMGELYIQVCEFLDHEPMIEDEEPHEGHVQRD